MAPTQPFATWREPGFDASRTATRCRSSRRAPGDVHRGPRRSHRVSRSLIESHGLYKQTRNRVSRSLAIARLRAVASDYIGKLGERLAASGQGSQRQGANPAREEPFSGVLRLFSSGCRVRSFLNRQLRRGEIPVFRPFGSLLRLFPYSPFHSTDCPETNRRRPDAGNPTLDHSRFARSS